MEVGLLTKCGRPLGRFLLRLLLGTLVVSAVFVLTQDIQIFPAIVSWPLGKGSGEISAAAKREGFEGTFIQTEDGKKLEVWYLPAPKNSKTPPRAVIYFHGNGEVVKNDAHISQWLQSLGYASFLFDYRGFGRSSGWPSEQGLQQDARALWRYAREKTGLSAEQFIFMGASVGTGPAAYLASEVHPRALILMSPYKSLTAVVEELPGFGLLSPFLWYKLPTEEYLKTIGSTCVVLIHGKRDRTIAYHHSVDMQRDLQGQIDISFISDEEAGHNDLLARTYQRTAQAMEGCFLKNSVTARP